MDERTLEALEFPALVERLANATATPHGEELARALVPSADADEVARRQALTAEAIALIDMSAEPPLEAPAEKVGGPVPGDPADTDTDSPNPD